MALLGVVRVPQDVQQARAGGHEQPGAALVGGVPDGPGRSPVPARRRSAPSAPRRRAPRKGDLTEQAILDTAQRLLAERPLSEIAIDELARGAGISRPSFYFYFESREGILRALAARITDELYRSSEVWLRRVHESPADAVRRAIGANLGVYYAGDYQLTVTGLDAGGFITHQVTQTLRVVGGKKNAYAVDVPQVSNTTTGKANLTWKFDGMVCTAPNVNKVTVLVDPDANGNGGVNAGTVGCNEAGYDGTPVKNLTPGPHTFAILGLRTLSDGDHLIYRTHHPAAPATIVAGAITDVFVSAESPP